MGVGDSSHPHRDPPEPTEAVQQGIEGGFSVRQRRITNDYSSYKPISTEAGQEQIRLLYIIPPTSDGGDDQDITCFLFDSPPNIKNIAYVPLSYCWGDMSRQRTIHLAHHQLDKSDHDLVSGAEGARQGDLVLDLEIEPQPFSVTESLYQALKSLRNNASHLAPFGPGTVFWVDALCINQSDVDERNRQVEIMRSIYSRGQYVLIWLGEDQRTRDGLNIIKAFAGHLVTKWGTAFNFLAPANDHIDELFRFQVNGMDNVRGPETWFQALNHLFGNSYFTRIWVLQEATCHPETFIHTKDGLIPWNWIILGNRIQTRWREKRYSSQPSILPTFWLAMVELRLSASPPVYDHQGKRLRTKMVDCRSHGHDETTIGCLPLMNLFTYTFDVFEATDPRDKLFALLDLGIETSPGSESRRRLGPDYNKSVSEVFSDFTLWCIQEQGDLTALRLLSKGPRRVSPEEIAMLPTDDETIHRGFLSNKSHPSWALWPNNGRNWSHSILINLGGIGGEECDLTRGHKGRLIDLSADAAIELPTSLKNRFLSLEGRRLGTVRSVLSFPLQIDREIATDSSATVKTTSNLSQEDIKKPGEQCNLTLNHPVNWKWTLNGGIRTLWNIIDPETVVQIDMDEGANHINPHEWSNKEPSRYRGKREFMFRDFLETLLLSPVYRGESSLSRMGSTEGTKGLPDGPWDDETLATSFALYWVENEPQHWRLPEKIRSFLLGEPLARKIPRRMLFPHLFRAQGKCLFLTEDERFGLCPPTTRPGDVVVALFGGQVPFVLRPVINEADFEGNAWAFKGCEQLRRGVYRMVGECYLHERMTSSFFNDEQAEMGDDEVFHLY